MLKQIVDLQVALEESNNELNAKNGILLKAKKTIVELQQRNADMEDDQISFQRLDNSELKAQNSNLSKVHSKKIEELKQQHVFDIERLEQRIQERDACIRGYRRKIQVLKHEYAEAINSLKDHDQAKADIRKQVNISKGEWQKKLEEYVRREAEHLTSISKLETERNGLIRKFRQHEDDMSVLRNENDDLKSQISKMTEKLNELGSSTHTLTRVTSAYHVPDILERSESKSNQNMWRETSQQTEVRLFTEDDLQKAVEQIRIEMDSKSQESTRLINDRLEAKTKLLDKALQTINSLQRSCSNDNSLVSNNDGDEILSVIDDSNSLKEILKSRNAVKGTAAKNNFLATSTSSRIQEHAPESSSFRNMAEIQDAMNRLVKSNQILIKEIRDKREIHDRICEKYQRLRRDNEELKNLSSHLKKLVKSTNKENESLNVLKKIERASRVERSALEEAVINSRQLNQSKMLLSNSFTEDVTFIDIGVGSLDSILLPVRSRSVSLLSSFCSTRAGRRNISSTFSSIQQ